MKDESDETGDEEMNPLLILLCLASLLTAVILLAPSPAPPAEAPTQAVPGRSDWIETTGNDIRGLPRGRTIRRINGVEVAPPPPLNKEDYRAILENSQREIDAERQRREARDAKAGREK